jgi:hypothetical protein
MESTMDFPLGQLSFFCFSFAMGIAMIVEGILIVLLQRQILPLPSKILQWASVRMAGKEKTAQWFAGKNTVANQRTYATYALVFGAAVVVSSFIYLNGILSAIYYP